MDVFVCERACEGHHRVTAFETCRRGVSTLVSLSSATVGVTIPSQAQNRQRTETSREVSESMMQRMMRCERNKEPRRTTVEQSMRRSRIVGRAAETRAHHGEAQDRNREGEGQFIYDESAPDLLTGLSLPLHSLSTVSPPSHHTRQPEGHHQHIPHRSRTAKSQMVCLNV
jgi:hypothetical protein